jgi:hypothetical protein
MKSYPQALTTDAIAERVSTVVNDTASLSRVLVSKIRRKIKAIGAPVPIKTVHWHRSYIWDPRGGGDEVSEVAAEA